MPIYLDRHDMPDEITAEHVAEMHQMDVIVLFYMVIPQNKM